jgi:hypothetical protein
LGADGSSLRGFRTPHGSIDPVYFSLFVRHNLFLSSLQKLGGISFGNPFPDLKIAGGVAISVRRL